MLGLREFGALILVAALSGCGGNSGGTAGSAGSAGSGGSAGGGGGEVPLRDEYLLSDEELVPESGAFDPTSRSFYVSSESKGSVTRVEADGSESVFYTPPVDETWRTLGVALDNDARRLWVCAQGAADERQEIWVFDLSGGERTLALDLSDAEAGSTCNDVAIDSQGLAYVSDSSNPRVYRADADEETVVTWAEDPLLAPNGAGLFGGNGIAVTDDDRYVIVSKTSVSKDPGTPPRLVRIAVTEPGSEAELVVMPELEGFADGISFFDGDLYIAMVGAGNIARLRSDDNWETASVSIATAGANAPVPGTSTVRPAEGRLYAIYSDITKALTGLTPVPPFRIFEVDLESFE